MNRWREFVGSSSGLAPLRKAWVAIALAGLVVLFGSNKADADADRTYCGDISWIQCFDCSSNSEHPNYAQADADTSTPPRPYRRADHPCTRADADPAEPEATYLYCTYALDALCDFGIVDCWYSSTPCSEAVPPTATNQTTDCWYYDECAEFNSTEPYRHCTTYHFDDATWESCLCSSSPCSEAVPTPTAVLTSAAGQPAQHRLGDAYPNPFNPAMVIPLDLATDQKQVNLALYDVLGRRVRQVWDGPLGAGRHRFVWDGRDEGGKAVAAGVYIYKVEMDGRVEAKKTTKLP